MIHKSTTLFLLPVLLHLAAGVGMMLYYWNATVIRWEAVVLHGLLVTAFFTTVAIVSIVLNRYSPKPAHHWIAAAALPLLSLWFVLQHITTFVAYLILVRRGYAFRPAVLCPAYARTDRSGWF